MRVEGLDADLGIERLDSVLRGIELRPADVGRAVDDLTLQVAEVDNVEVDDAESADTRRGEIERRRRPEAAGADQEHARRLQPALPFLPDFRQQEVPAVALPLFRREIHGPSR